LSGCPCEKGDPCTCELPFQKSGRHGWGLQIKTRGKVSKKKVKESLAQLRTDGRRPDVDHLPTVTLTTEKREEFHGNEANGVHCPPEMKVAILLQVCARIVDML
jgi:hypothetical protein